MAKGSLSRGFSLIELLVVILIIAIVVAIVLPALGTARDAARTADSRNLVTSLGQACAQYKIDTGRLPGYFSQADMASSDNSTRGFSQMQNVMLDLAGGVDPTASLAVGPLVNPANHVRVEPQKVGVKQPGQNIYFSPSGKFLARQDGTEGGQRFGVSEHAQLAELVDAFGTPVLMWMADDRATGAVTSISTNSGNPFVLQEGPAAPAGARARFYLNTNKPFLEAGNFVGKQRIDQGARSLLGADAARSTANRLTTLAAILGNPNSPADTTLPIDQILPTAGRGSYVIHAAGADATYLRTFQKGAKMHAVDPRNGPIYFGKHFKTLPAPGNPLTDANGKPTSADFIADFDDIIQAGE
jgi:prepilin-type N-terminal cleavage/methylation domain-containing protein